VLAELDLYGWKKEEDVLESCIRYGVVEARIFPPLDLLVPRGKISICESDNVTVKFVFDGYNSLGLPRFKCE